MKIHRLFSFLLAGVFCVVPFGQAFAGDVTEARCLVAAQAKFVFENPDVQALFSSKGLHLTTVEANTTQMVAAAASQDKPDCLILSSDAGITLLKAKGVKFNEADKDYVFKTYPVTVVRGDIVDALTQMGVLAEQRSDDGSTRLVYVNFEALVNAAIDGKQWSQLPGFEKLDAASVTKIKSLRGVKLFSTSPAANSGLFVAIVFGNIRAATDVLVVESWTKVSADIKRYFSSLGAKPMDAGKLLSEFLTSRAKPVVIVYESQLIEFAVTLKKLADQGDAGASATLVNLTKYARLVYFEPTLDANHPAVPLSAVGRTVVEAMKDPAFRVLAWEKHGFRPFVVGGELDVKHLEGVLPGVVSVPLQVNPLPEEVVQDLIKESLK